MVRSVAFGPKGDTVAKRELGQNDSDLGYRRQGSRLEKCVLNCPASVNSIAYLPDGKQLISGGRYSGKNHALLLWDLTATPPSSQAIGGKLESDVNSVAISPNGSLLAAGGNHTISLSELEPNGALPFANLAPATGQMVFSADSKSLASKILSEASLIVSEVRIWDVTDNMPQEKATVEAGQDLVTALAFAPDGKTLVAASQDKLIYIWDLSAPKPKALEPLAQHKDSVSAVVISADGKKMVSAGHDGLVVVWDTTTWKVDREWILSGAVLGLAVARGDRYLATANENGTAYIIDTRVK